MKTNEALEAHNQICNLGEENNMLKIENEFLLNELRKISELSLDKVVDYKDGYEKCRKIAKKALIPIYAYLIPNQND